MPEKTLKKFENCLIQKRYSVNTRKIYCHYFKDFQTYFKDDKLEDISTEQINKYILNLIISKKISVSQQNQRINAIKFYYEKVLGLPHQYYKIERPKKENKLPKVLSKEEISLIFSRIENLKHKMIISLLYSGGLRRSEILALKVSDIHSNRGLLRINGAKGKKDRFTLLSKALLEQLREYYRQYHPKTYLFEGQKGDNYSAESVSKILKQAGIKAGIQQIITLHILRHSFATHLPEQGTDLRYIQELLEHNNSKTTEIYTHITKRGTDKIKSPLENINL